MLRLPSKNTTWNLTVAALSEVQPNCWRFLHSITSSLLGAAPATAQKTFWPVPATGKRSSHHGATKVVACEVGTDALENAVNEPVKFTFPLLLTKSVDRKSTRLNSSHLVISYAVFCLKKKKKESQNIVNDFNY